MSKKTQLDRHAIITLPHEDLRKKSEKVRFIDDSTLQLITDMETATLDWDDHRDHELSVALAAVQIDRLQRVVIIRNNFDDKADRTFTALINPEIVKAEGRLVEDFEGCLSVKDLYGKVPRYEKVRVRATDVNGREVRVTARGFLARVLQHEIDHTNGQLFLDKLQEDSEIYRLDDSGKLKKLANDEYGKFGLLR